MPLIVLLALFVVGDLAGQPRFQQLVEVVVEPGRELAYESYLKKLVEAAEKTETPMRWATFSVAAGKTQPTYRVAFPFERWAERDRWADATALLVEAFGESEAATLIEEGRAAVSRATTQIWEQLLDSSANSADQEGQAKFYDVRVRRVSRASVADVRQLHRRFAEAYASDPAGPHVTRWVLRFGEHPDVTFRRAQGFDSWAEFERGQGLDLVSKHFGEQERQNMVARYVAMEVEQERFISTLRPDLSRD